MDTDGSSPKRGAISNSIFDTTVRDSLPTIADGCTFSSNDMVLFIVLEGKQVSS